MDRTSLWQGTADKRPCYPTLQGEISVDVAIVGAGITALTAAMLLAQRGRKVALLESHRIGTGTTGHATGNLYAPVDLRLATIEDKHGTDVLRAVAQSRSTAVDFIERTSQSLAIDCAFTRCPWYLLASSDEFDAQVEQELAAAQRAGLQATLAAAPPAPLAATRTVQVANQAQFQPLDYVRQLAQHISGEQCLVFENTHVTGIDDEPATVHTQAGKVRCKQVILATHTPLGVHLVQSGLEVVREYGIAFRLDSLAPDPGIYWSIGEHNHSVRTFTKNDETWLIVVGAAHKTGDVDDTERRHAALEAFGRLQFQGGPLAYRWSAQRYRPKDALPYIGKNIDANNTWIATGFSGDGLTWGTLAGMLLADALTGTENAWAPLFQPARLASAPRPKAFAKETMSPPQPNLLALETDVAERFGDLPACASRQEDIDGKPVAAWRDDQGRLFLVAAKCTHLGCKLRWNEAETSWDCPCHGSRFRPDGQVIEGPALAPLARGTGPDCDAATPPAYTGED
ncbi:FAD-dependent oxidoreductase [Massilia horti]|uniref:FAD-dependent oxidoreductase n=1 Tax=Massilia horti TaxID=2562153 RepID=A0A4Y9SXZ8_9BURK|nr:FAD-dependent oxidoreductase [Massilia horti]TFW31309.1 FAD-dependent oxidoreductase [Massilia horti]